MIETDRLETEQVTPRETEDNKRKDGHDKTQTKTGDYQF